MGANELTFELKTEQAEAKLLNLERLAQRVQSTIQGAGSSPEAMRAGMSGGHGASAAVNATATVSVSGPPEAVSAWNATVAKFPGLGPSAYQQIAGQLGVTFNPASPPGTGPAGAITNLHQTAQFTKTLVLPAAATMQMPAGGGGMFGPGYLDTTTMMMPSWQAPMQNPAYAGARAISFNNAGIVPTQQMSAMQLPDWGGAYRASFQMNPVASRMAGGLAISAGQAFAMAGQRTVTGGPDIMGQGQLAGATIGGLLAAPFGPMAMAAGAAFGSGVGSWLAAPAERDRQIMASVFTIAGAFDMNMGATLGWAGQRADAFRGGSNVRTFSAGAVGAMYSTAASAMFTGGLDPMSPAGYNPMFRAPIQPGDRERRGGAGGMIAGMARTALNGIRHIEDIEYGRENLAQAVVRRVGMRYPEESAATEVMNRIAPIYGDLPSNGGNIADILVKHGPLDTFRFLQSQVEPGVPEAVPRDDLRRASEGFRRSGRELEFAGMQVRGSGSATAMAARRRMNTLSTLPGGRDSVAYMEAFTLARSGSMEQFGDDLTTRFGIPQVGYREQIARARLRPYAPGEVFGAQVGLIRSQLGEAGAIDSFINHRRAAGELGVDEEYSLRSRSAGARVAAFTALSDIAMGAQNLLPGIQAGGGFGTGLRRFTGMQQAAAFINPYAFFRRDAGFTGGAAANRANHWLDGMGVPSSPVSRSEGANNPATAGSLDRAADRLERAAEAIRKAFDRGGGSFQRPQKDPRGMPNGGRGGGAPWN